MTPEDEASYQHGIAWIGENDDPLADALPTWPTVILMAGLFERFPSVVAADVNAWRKKHWADR